MLSRTELEQLFDKQEFGEFTLNSMKEGMVVRVAEPIEIMEIAGPMDYDEFKDALFRVINYRAQHVGQGIHILLAQPPEYDGWVFIGYLR